MLLRVSSAHSQRRSLHLPEDRASRIALIGLALLVAFGALLRVLMMSAQTPGFTGASDTAWYLIAAHTNVFVWAAGSSGGNPWPAGYPLFLGLVYEADRQLSAVALVQHLLGIGTALLWYSTVRRVVSPLWALLPAAVILLAGPQLMLEHAVMPEVLFSLLMAGSAYCAIRALDGNLAAWGALAGLLAAAAGCVRVVGLILVPLVLLWLFVASSGNWRRRLLGAGAACVAAGLLIGTYLAEMKRETGYGGPALTRAGTWSAPKPGGQPGRSYLSRVGHDLTRYWRSADKGGAGGYSYNGLATLVSSPGLDQRLFPYRFLTQGVMVSNVISWYATTTPTVNRGLRSTMFRYERLTRLEDIRFVLVLLAGIGGLVLARGRRRALGALTLGMAAVVLITPVLYVFFDARYGIPGYGPLAAAGAIGAASIWERVAPWLRARELSRWRPKADQAPS